jgi:uncharacterized protein (DUF1800 family)
MSITHRALNRFGLGARPGEPSRVSDPRGWLGAQLEGGAPSLPDPASAERRAVADVLGGRPAREVQQDEALRDRLRRAVTAVRNAETGAALARRVTSERPFVERLVAFWSNHLCVSAAGNPRVAPLAGPYEREAIRPHVLGRFEDLVLASARHPAMLLYLDQADSVGPGSRVARNAAARSGRVRGLNENYARELLELHTLGVNGGYKQEDVQELARALTGWSVGLPDPASGIRGRSRIELAAATFGFEYRANLHEPGARTVLGRRYAERAGARGDAQAEAIVRDLCAHPSTARFVATKLVRHFVADEPPARAVDAVATEFTRTGGDLARVACALVALPEAWDPERRKLRTPQDWVTAVLRGLGAEEAPGSTVRSLAALRQPLWAPPAPKGWGDTTREWADPDSLMNRAELARTIARRVGRRADPAALLELVEVAASDPIHDLVADRTVGRQERVALVLAGPAFQWR